MHNNICDILNQSSLPFIENENNLESEFTSYLLNNSDSSDTTNVFGCEKNTDWEIVSWSEYES
jgi:hypothetical protein